MFEEYNITALTDIPPLVRGFATDAGWTVTGTTPEPIFTNPAIDALPIKMRYLADGANSTARENLQLLMPEDAPEITAFISNPRYGTVSLVPVHTQPTKLCLFGDERFIGMVICYGYNHYRHLYMGYMEKLGDYDGGDVISGSHFRDTFESSSTGNPSFRHPNIQFPFNALHSAYTGRTGTPKTIWGGVFIDHADTAADKYRDFCCDDGLSGGVFAADFVAGGFKDDINDPYLARGKSEYAGQHLLCPINLYAARASNNYSPIGRPPGVRMCIMEGVDPEQSILVGSQPWRVFPIFGKSIVPTYEHTNLLVGSYPREEKSYLVGIAYQEEE